MNTPINEQAIETRRAIQHGEEALANIRQSLDNAMREIMRSQERYPDATLEEKARIVNHALSTICAWATVNARLGLAADAQAELFAAAKAQAVLA
jgi:hypothetical protein